MDQSAGSIVISLYCVFVSLRTLLQLQLIMEEGDDFSLCGKEVVTEAHLRNDDYWRLIADFIGPQSGEGLELQTAQCKNKLLIQVGLLKEDNNFPWVAITGWLRKIFPSHQSADFRRLIERGIATTLSLGAEARSAFLESDVNFNFVGPICDSIGVERQHLLEMKDFSEQAKLIEVTNGLILELNNFVIREKIAPVVMVAWLRNFNPAFCKNGDMQKAYKVLRPKIKKLRLHYCNNETSRHRRNPAMEDLLRSPFELVRKKMLKALVKKRMRRDNVRSHEKVKVKEEYDSYEITPGEESEMYRRQVKREPSSGCDSDADINSGEDRFDRKVESLTLLDIAIRSVQKLSKVYGGTTAASRQLSLDLLRNHYTLTCREHPAMGEFEKKLDSLSGEVNLVSPVVFLSSNANFLVDLQDAVEKQIMNFEKEIILSTGEQIGRDKLPKFKKFVNLEESATSRYINMACDILNPCSGGTQNHRRHWMAFCEEKNNPSRLNISESNQFNSYFETAAGLTHHHKEIAPFFSDLLSLDDSCPNVILESVAADAGDLVIQSFVCVLAIVYCKILGPYQQLLKSTGEYSLFSHFMLCLYQRFLNWTKDPSSLLEPEGDTNVFMQFPYQEKTFEGVFHYCGQWHTNIPLIKACLKRVVKAIAGVTDEHLKDFLPGGTISQTLTPEQKSKLASCTFSVLMAEYPFGDTDSCKTGTPKKTSKRLRHRSSSSDSSQEDDDLSSSSDDSSDDSSEERWRKGTKHYKKKVVKEEFEENTDREYIEAVVNRNGGPCKTQQDVDKMLLRFDGKPRADKREAVRCEILYQKMFLHNPDPNLNCVFLNSTHMTMKLKLALPRVKPGFSLVLAPDKRERPGPRQTPDPASEQSESSPASEMCDNDE